MLNTKYKILILFFVSVTALSGYIFLHELLKKTNVSAQTPNYDWPQVQNNPQHTGYSPETLGTNFSVAWTHPFQPEKIYPQVQAIVYQGKVFVGTEMGNLYGLNATNGTQAWKFTAGSPILASVAAANGNVYFGAMDGAVYSVNANTGTQVWKKQVLRRHGFSVAPVFAENKIMLGGRDGKFYALDPSNGNILWQYTIGSPIYQTAAYNNGRVFFGAMDMYVYALNTSNGTLAWKSQKIDAMAFKDYWPVVFQGNVYIRAMTPNKNFFAFNENTGVESFNLPQDQSQTMNGATAPPCVDSGNRLVIPAGVPGQDYLSGWARLSPPSDIIPISTATAGSGNPDETMNVTCTGNLIFVMHIEEYNANYTGAFNMNNQRWTRIGYGWKNGQMSSNTQGGGGNPASVANGMIYHISYYELVARTTN